MNLKPPIEAPATIPNKREVLAQGIEGSLWRSWTGLIVFTASKTVGF
jgi:hypothetical protein